MNRYSRWACPFLLLPLFLLGCTNSTPVSQEKPQDKEAKIKAALAQLDPDDRTLAEEQKFCAVETENRLGSMGKPIKLTIEDETVFLCCKGCEKAARKDAKKTLARVEELRVQVALDHLDPADRKLAEQQRYCAVSEESRLGSMDVPVKIMIKDQPVFLCCKGCEKAAKKDADKTLATVKKLKADARKLNHESHE
jgi:hypothetical protein